MADEETQDAGTPGLHPVLDAFRSAFSTPASQDWADGAVLQMQHHLDRVEAADTARQSGENFVNNLDSFKQGLIGLARKDPSLTPMALDLVPHTINALMEAHPADDAGEHASGLTAHIQSEIARAGVQAWAIQDEGAANRALERYRDHLTDEDRTELGDFIDVMSRARAVDHQAQMVEEARKRQQASDGAAHSYVSALTDPQTGDIRLPNHFARNVMIDPRLDTEARSALWRVHENLSQGDVLESNPRLVSDIVQRVAAGDDVSPMAVLREAGDGLRLQDAQMLSALAASPKGRGYASALQATLDTGRRILATPENGPAGVEAFGRFTNWLIPTAAQAGPGALDPKSDNWLFAGEGGIVGQAIMGQFMPHIGDFAEGALRNYPVVHNSRPSLDSIFSRKAPEGDEVIRNIPIPPVAIPEVMSRPPAKKVNNT